MSSMRPLVDHIRLYVCTVCDAEFSQMANYRRHLLGTWHLEHVARAAAAQSAIGRCAGECTMIVRQLTVTERPASLSSSSVDPTNASGLRWRRRKPLDCPAPHCRARLATRGELNTHWVMCVIGGIGRPMVVDDDDDDGVAAAESGEAINENYVDTDSGDDNGYVLAEMTDDEDEEVAGVAAGFGGVEALRRCESEPINGDPALLLLAAAADDVVEGRRSAAAADHRRLLGRSYDLVTGETMVIVEAERRRRRWFYCEVCTEWFVKK